MPGNRKTYLAVHLEAPARRHKTEAGRAEGVVRREGYAPVVDAIRVRGARRSAQGEVPLEEVFVERGGMVVFCWVFGEFVGFPDCRLSAKLEGEGGGG